jgi:hypothetical protein
MRSQIVRGFFLIISFSSTFYPSLAAEQHGTPNFDLHHAQKDNMVKTTTSPPIKPITVKISIPVEGSS